jgi:hypothetical protein
MLFDLEDDPWEMHDLSNNPQFADKLKELREETRSWMKTNKDLSLIPAPFRWEISPIPLYQMVRETDYPLDELIDLAWAASEGNPAHMEQLTQALRNPRPEFRFWGASGFATLAYFDKMNHVIPELETAMKSDHPVIAAVAGEAIFRFDPKTKIIQTLLNNPSSVSNMMSLLSDHAERPEMRNPILSMAQANNPKKTETYNFRSYLISIGELPMSSLYTEKDIESAYIGYRRQLNWKQHLPNPPGR